MTLPKPWLVREFAKLAQDDERTTLQVTTGLWPHATGISKGEKKQIPSSTNTLENNRMGIAKPLHVTLANFRETRAPEIGHGKQRTENREKKEGKNSHIPCYASVSHPP